MNILICNAGSTSLKFKLYRMPQEAVLCEGKIERVGDPAGGIFSYIRGDFSYSEENSVNPDYESGIRRFLLHLTDRVHGALASLGEIDALGFKTVLANGYYQVHRIDSNVISAMEQMLPVAPAHNKHYLEAIRTFERVLPEVPRVGSFETGFHYDIPAEDFLYPLPYEWHEKYGVRRYGYHGASHGYAADCLTERLGERYRALSFHLGGSCSISGIVNGKSIGNSFGFSLQSGMFHGNRTGDFDFYILPYLEQVCGLSRDEIMAGLEQNGGLLGLSGVSNDMRDVEEAACAGNARAELAIGVFCREAVRIAGGYIAQMGGLDALVFTGGIGENSALVRGRIMQKLAFLGLVPDEGGFVRKQICRVSAENSRVLALVVPCNEELGIARRIERLLRGGAR